MKMFKKIIIIFSLAIFSFSGCAPIFKFMQPEDAQSVKKIAIVTSLKKEEFSVSDHSGYVPGSMGGATGGLVGALVEVIIVTQIMKPSLDVDPDLLRQEIKNFSMKKVFDDYFIESFSTDKFEIITPQQINNVGINEYNEVKSVDGWKIKDYTALYKQFGVDSVLEISYIYGIATYAGGMQPSAIISADVSVINIPKNKLLMRKKIESDLFYRKGYTIDEFRANNAELFKKEILEAIQGFAHLVAKEFGIELSLKRKSYWQTEKP